ncbi:non-specific lethal 1 isoform 1-T6 [Glossina fuscipes fuscipes]
MAPALTEPLSPKEKLTSSAVTARATPTTRSSKKPEPLTNKTNNNFNVVKSTTNTREKRTRAGTLVQNPSSSKRLTRSRDAQQPCHSSRVISNNNNNKIKINKFPAVVKNNEQMGLSAALLNPNNNSNKNKGNKNNNNSNINDTILESKASAEKSIDCQDNSTAQLLADLTNEAITAEICLRQQLKDVNLVKSATGTPISPVQTDDNDIVVLKAAITNLAAIETNQEIAAHMEAAQSNETLESKRKQDRPTSEIEEVEESQTSQSNNDDENDVIKSESEDSSETQTILEETVKNFRENEMEQGYEALSNQLVAMVSATVSETEPKKPDTSKSEIIAVQELPPVNTDSTMTASEVEDNLEERLSQLDGTAIDSPPPNQEVDTCNSSDKNDGNAVASTPPHTPLKDEKILQEDVLQLQQQLQQTPPTSASPLPQNQQMLQQQNNYTPQSTTSSLNTLGSGNMPPGFMKDAEGGELEDQDIEEVFKVLKGIESGGTSDLNMCDLNVLFNEVYTSLKINEADMGGSGGTVGHIANVTSNTPSIQPLKPAELQEGQAEIEKRQQQMQRKVEFMLRRMRKLQARYICKHASEEIAGLFEWSARHAGKFIGSVNINETGGVSLNALAPHESNKHQWKVIAARPPATLWKEEISNLVPATQICSFLRKLETAANAQQLCTVPSTSFANLALHHKKTKKALLEAQAAIAAAASSSMSSALATADGKAEDVVVPTLDEEVADELTQVAGLLQTEMSEVQRAIDSDATESSSGGESADEMVTYNNQHQQTLPITKRAAWRYSRDRAAIASRWSWLLSQIADLEIKIRQHSELYQEIARTKGAVTCGLPENGLRTDPYPTQPEHDNKIELPDSCRTRGFEAKLFRKRKLIQTTNIHTISKKAARPSTIKCGCQWPLHPCALCTGRADPTAPRDPPDTMMMSDRIALLDPGYHPVLSFREDVNNALHFEAIARLPEWQHRVMRCQAKSIAKSVWKAEREAAAAAGYHLSRKHGKEAIPKRKYVKKKDRLNEEKAAAAALARTSMGPSKSSSSSAAAAASSSSIDTGNGTATLSTSSTSTTPLVANKVTSRLLKKSYCHQMSNTNRMKEPLTSPSLNNNQHSSALINNGSNNSYAPQPSDYLHQSYDAYKPNQALSSLISQPLNSSCSSSNNSKNNKYRKHSTATISQIPHQMQQHTYSTSQHNNHYNSNNAFADTSLLHSTPINDNWVDISTRSRTSSPTYGVGNYPKYERMLDRKNRSSYDIDNIVIPYSVAASTRVEILPYKEIPTPKWRVIENENELNNDSEQDQLDICNKSVTEIEQSQLTAMNGLSNCDQSKASEMAINVDDDDGGGNEQKKSKIDQICDPVKINNAIINEKSSENNVNEKTVIMQAELCSGNREDKNYFDVTKEPEPKKIKIDHHDNDDDDDGDDDDDDDNDHNNTTEKCNIFSSEEKINNNHQVRVVDINGENDQYDDDAFALEEDISDEAMILRHERALTEERRKFQTYLKFPWSTRSRANRRIDSRAESSGANTPDPSSPAPQNSGVGCGDQESIPSPLTSNSLFNTLDATSEAGDTSTSFLGINSEYNKRCERRRTTSTKRDREFERRSATPDFKEIAPPYEPMTFPLSDELYDDLLRAMTYDQTLENKQSDDYYLSTAPVLKYPRNNHMKRGSRSSTVSGGGGDKNNGRGGKINTKITRPMPADDAAAMINENGDLMASIYNENIDDDDYPRHHLAPNDDLGFAGRSFNNHNDNDYYDDEYGAYVGRKTRQGRGNDSDGESTDTDPFQDDDPNDPEWCGESGERIRKKP